MDPFDPDLLPKASGLTNIGQTCYFNSMLQALLTCTSLTKTILTLKPLSKNKLLLAYAELIQNPNPNQSVVIWQTMMDILKQTQRFPHFRDQQQDSHESFHIFLELLGDPDPEKTEKKKKTEEGEEEDKKAELSEVEKIFRTRFRSRIVCKECGTCTESKQEEIFINLNQTDKIPESIKYKNSMVEDYTCDNCAKAHLLESPKKCEMCTKICHRILYDRKLLMCPDCQPNFIFTFPDNYKTMLCDLCTNIYEIIHDNPYKRLICDKCKPIYKEKKTQVTIQTRLTMVRSCIVILFNKYENKYLFNYPESFSIGENNQFVYKAVAQIEHSGGMNGGHYWALAKRNGGDYVLNDGSASPASLNPTDSTYLVFYHLQ